MKAVLRKSQRHPARLAKLQAEEDPTDLAQLYDAIQQQPSSVQLHERLLRAWVRTNEKDAAFDVASTLLRLDPNNQAARQYVQSEPSVRTRGMLPGWNSNALDPREMSGYSAPTAASLESDYLSLKFDADLLRHELEAISELGAITLEEEDLLPNLRAINEGRISCAVSKQQSSSVRELARRIAEEPTDCQELVIEDFQAYVLWLINKDPPLEPDVIRSRLVKRRTLLEAALPDSMAQITANAFSNIERDYLFKTYNNSETMLGDRIQDIQKQNFFVSEDNYAWDIDELANAIASNGGVMRNPLSREMFSEADIRTIIAHPLGQRLKALQLTQNDLLNGVRPATVDKVERLGRTMLEDQSDDAETSRIVMDEFLAFAVTLPESEQAIINDLKIPAKDKHTGQDFDYTIGDSIGDAKANVACFHKVGDFLSQAADYLKSVKSGDDPSWF